MKKSLLVAAIAMVCAIGFNTPNAYASSHNGVKDPDVKTTSAVHQDFPNAQRISWGEDGGKFIARFNCHNRKITATYRKGHLLSTLIYSDAGRIPFEIQTNLDKKYPGYAAQGMKEFITKADHGYYFILKNQNGNLVQWLSVKSDGHGNFKVLEKFHQIV